MKRPLILLALLTVSAKAQPAPGDLALDIYLGGGSYASWFVTPANGKCLVFGPAGIPQMASMSGDCVTALGLKADSSSMTAGLALKMDIPAGTTAQYMRGDGSVATFPTIPTVPTAISAFTNDSGYVTSSSLTTTLSGYVTSVSLTSTLGSYTTTAFVTSGLAGKFATPVGTTAQYLRGDGSLATSPTNLSSFTNGPGYITNATGLLSAGTGISFTGSGTSGSPYVITAINSGTVTSVIAGTGLSGGTITSTGTISMPNTGTAGTYSGVTFDAQGRETSGTNRSFTSNPARVVQTVAAAANGWQISATRDSRAQYSVSTSTTANISGNASVVVVFEICATNSATAGDWVTIGKISNAQAVSLAVVLQSVQTNVLSIERDVPAGYYCRLRSTISGTGSASYDSGQEILQ